MKKQRRWVRILLGLDLLVAVLVFGVGTVAVNLRAAEQSTGTNSAPTPATTTGDNGKSSTPAPAAPEASKAPAGTNKTPADTSKAGGHRSASEPQVPESTATIRDDPTIAPDPQESADNNVSFPSDI